MLTNISLGALATRLFRFAWALELRAGNVLAQWTSSCEVLADTGQLGQTEGVIGQVALGDSSEACLAHEMSCAEVALMWVVAFVAPWIQNPSVCL